MTFIVKNVRCHTIHIIRIHTKSPPCKIVTFSVRSGWTLHTMCLVSVRIASSLCKSANEVGIFSVNDNVIQYIT